MSVERFRELAAKRLREQEEIAARGKARKEELDLSADFFDAWMCVDPGNIRSESDACQREIAEKLRLLHEGIRERYWDFHLAELVKTQQFPVGCELP